MPRLPKSGPDQTTVVGRIQVLVHRILKPYLKMSKKGKITFWSITAAHFAVVGLIILFRRQLGNFFNQMALSIRDMGFWGYFVLIGALVLSSHPPLFGFSGSLTLIGFTYGIWPGFLVASTGALLGGALSFLSIQTFFLSWMRRWGSSKNEKWEAFGHVMRDKGWPLVAMIRWCPLPWAIGNGLFASIEGVQFWHFMLANILYLPRLLVPVFIGSRLNSLTDDGGEEEPDRLRDWLNVISIGASLVVSVLTGIWIYRLTLAQMRKVDYGQPGEGELAAEALEETTLLGDYSGDDEEEELVPTRGTLQV